MTSENDATKPHHGPLKQESAAVRAEDENLLRLALAPGIWLLHFFSCYLTVALWCAKVEPLRGPLGTARWLCVGYSAIALIAIVICARHAYRRHALGDETIPYDDDTAADRHRFLGFAELLLAALSFVATCYVALPFGILSTCR